MTLVFGSTELAIAAVLASYMAGLALGASLIGRFLKTIKKPIKLYAVLEVLIAVSALLVPFLLDWVSSLYHFIYASNELTSVNRGFAIIYLLGSFFVLLIPTTLMGATLPILSRFIVKSGNNIGNKIGSLYSINTFGACLGALFSAFIFLPQYGLQITVYIAVAINTIIFVVGIVMFQNKSVDKDINEYPQQAKTVNKWILIVMLISGLVSLAYEVLWTRLLSQILGGSVYSFGVMLFIFLLGIALGAAIGSWLCKKSKPIYLFIVVQIGIALSFLMSMYFADYLVNIAMSTDFGSIEFVLDGLFIGALTLLPGALFIGATFPLAIFIAAKDYRTSGELAARIYSWNTVGAIFGAILMGFYLLPNFGFAISTKILFSISVTIAIITVLMTIKSTKLIVFCASLLVINFWLPMNDPIKLLRTSALSHKIQEGEIKYFGIGSSATVMLVNQGQDMRLLSNGLPESSIQIQGARIGSYHLANWLSMLPVLSYPKAETMLVIGLGAGITVKAVPDSIQQIDVVELEQEVIKANQMMSSYRGTDPLKDSRVKLYKNDARNALINSQQKFDIIVSQPSHPWTVGASNLYTQEFFSLVKNRLNKNGKFVQWIGMNFVDVKLLKSLLATLNKEFDFVELYQPLSKGGLIFLASNNPIQIDSTLFKNSIMLDNMNLLGVSNFQDFKIFKRMDAISTKALSKDAEISTDFRNILKIQSPKIINKSLDVKTLTAFIGEQDPLIKEINGEKGYSIISRLLLEKGFDRALLLADSVSNTSYKKVLKAIILDAQLPNKQNYRNLLQMMSHGQHSEEIFYYLMMNRLSAVKQEQLPRVIIEFLDSNPKAKNLYLAWRLYQSNKWNQLKALDPQLNLINETDVAYSFVYRLKMGWRVQSNIAADNRQGLKMIENQMAINPKIMLIKMRIIIAVKLNLMDEALASIYELINISANNVVKNPKLDQSIKQYILTYENQLNKNKNQASLKRHQQKLQQLKNYYLLNN
ncbi:MAG: fused MFS/spermidine synthase [Marinicellaceae bacterium]